MFSGTFAIATFKNQPVFGGQGDGIYFWKSNGKVINLRACILFASLFRIRKSNLSDIKMTAVGLSRPGRNNKREEES